MKLTHNPSSHKLSKKMAISCTCTQLGRIFMYSTNVFAFFKELVIHF